MSIFGRDISRLQVTLSSLEVIKVLDDPGLQQDKTRAMWFIGLGTGGPAVTAGSMLLLYQVAIAFVHWPGAIVHSVPAV